MQLFYAPQTISAAVALVLEEARQDYDPVRVDFAQSEQTKPAYLQINPKARVPALTVEGGILTETGAILDYIAALAPQAGMVPDDPLHAARMREVMYYLASTMHVNHAHKLRGARWADQEASWQDMTAKVAQTMTASCDYIETHALRGPFVLGDRFSLADAYLFVVCTWLEGDGVDVSAFPKITAFRTAMEVRPSVRAIRAKGML